MHNRLLALPLVAGAAAPRPDRVRHLICLGGGHQQRRHDQRRRLHERLRLDRQEHRW
ncbi:hypothetical protein Q9Q99_15140 [Curtobacterium flaccumfaciens]|nr:hypothetical protein Q9Q99_15140 [Curtobacterium flaccumfaciens]